MFNKNNSGQAKYKNRTSSNTIRSLINMCRERNRAEDIFLKVPDSNDFWYHIKNWTSQEVDVEKQEKLKDSWRMGHEEL